MRRFLGIALALVLLPAVAGAECRLGHVATLPFQIRNGHLLVQGKINGETATMIFDTGAATTFLTEAAVGHLNLRPVQSEAHDLSALGRAEGIGGESTARAVEAQSMNFGGLRARQYAFFAADIKLGSIQPVPDGLLSADVLAKYDIDLDFAGGNIRLYYPLSDCSQPAAYLHGPLTSVSLLPGSADRSPHINVSVGDQTLVAVIDTGAPNSVLFRSGARKLGIDPAGPGQRMHTLHGTGPHAVPAFTHILPVLGVGDLEFRNKRVEVANQAMGDAEHPDDMLLGLDFLTAVHPWISYSSMTLILQFPPTPSPKD